MSRYFADASGTEKDDARGENPWDDDPQSPAGRQIRRGTRSDDRGQPMTLHKHAQVRADLNAADRVVRACWSNFIATEPTYVLRDLIVIEIQNARDAERERCAGIVEKLAGADAVYPAGVEMLLEAIRNPIN